MSDIEAKVIEDSVSNGKRITTLQLKYHRYIHGEFMTHRVFSRNASSSRAIPVQKMLSQVWNDPAIPVHWGKNQPGMQANEQLQGYRLKLAKMLWKLSGKAMCVFAYCGMKVGMHKQIANRILEPWQYIHVIVTATEWDNFFELRDHKDAQPEIRVLAKRIKYAMEHSPAKVLKEGEWHLPYCSKKDRELYDVVMLRKLSAARCARVSYLTHDGLQPSEVADLKLFDRLVGGVPHFSPLEHQATPVSDDMTIKSKYITHKLKSGVLCSGNLTGWVQFRQIVSNDLYNRK